MARALPERDATSLAGPENSTSSFTVAKPQREREEPCRLLQRAAGLLGKGDLKSASETLKEATLILASRSGNDGAPALLSTEEKKRTKSRRTTNTEEIRRE